MYTCNQTLNKEWIIHKYQKQRGNYHLETKAEADLEETHGRFRWIEAPGLEAENLIVNSTDLASACEVRRGSGVPCTVGVLGGFLHP